MVTESGHHRRWISDLEPCQSDFQGWRPRYGLRGVLQEIHDHVGPAARVGVKRPAPFSDG